MTVSVWWLIAALIVSVALEVLVVRVATAACLSYAPLSGDETDSVTYQRSLFTPGERALLGVWGGLVAAGLLWWLGAAYDSGWLVALGLLAWLGALAWDVWTWERVAASVKFVSWRRGWQHSTRRVPVSQVHQLHVVEKESVVPLGLARVRIAACYIALEMADGKAIKLPRTAVIGGLERVENVANFVRLQMQMVEDTRKRVAAEKRAEARRAGKPSPDEERDLRKELIKLRRQAAGRGTPEA